MNLKALMQEIEKAPSGTEQNDCFARKMGAIYFLRHIHQYYSGDRTELRYVAWVLGRDKCHLGQFVVDALPGPRKNAFIADLAEAGSHIEDYADQVSSAIKDTPSAFRKKMKSFIKQSILKKLETIEYSGRSEIEKNVEAVQKMFNLERHEIDMVVFFFIMASFNVPESLFDINLGCDRFSGRKYLDNILRLTTTQTARTISKLEMMGIMYDGHRSIGLDDDIITLLQNPHSDQLSKQFFQPVNPCNIPLDFHFVDQDVLTFLKQLVRIKSESSSNILFYGPPGTGKSTMANALASSSNVSVYAITRDERNKSENRRTAITACMNMTNTGKGSVIIVDEADNLLNTMNSWFLRGETQDKGWLNSLLERPGTRMIWITNRVDGIEDSVLRRFAYVLEFNRLNDLDTAALRRFTFKVGFDYLTSNGKLIFYTKLLQPMLKKKLTEADRKCIRGINRLAPGDFKTVRKRFAYYDRHELNHKMMIKQLQIESTIKSADNKNQRIGF
jgi:GTPase SAR1 family protein